MTTSGPDRVFVVGIGASAGGIQAVKQFFEAVPRESGLSFVVILHLSPDHDSHLAAIIQTSARLPVAQVQDRLQVRPNHAYVIPPNRSLSMQDGHLIVSDISRIEERRAPVDVFFRTLAESHGSHAACVVLSGTGANGSMGLKRVKEHGGLCLVQDPDEAEYHDMPRNAIATGLVDHVLPVRQIPGRILAYRESLAAVHGPDGLVDPVDGDAQALREVFAILRARTGHDFSNYKRATISRRIARRMVVHGISSLSAYASLVRDRLDEAPALLKDLLISVTNFFRDREAFEALERRVIPELFKGKTGNDQVRVWVPGCATGEEAYSIGMLLAERAADEPGPDLVVFATDIDASAIAVAREGLFTLNDAADVSPERLRRFFTRDGDAYRVRKELRELILFAPQNVLKDPPFSHLDLVSCRNLLIYLNRSAQRRVMDVLHFALNPSGYLFLGASEAVEGAGDLFVNVDDEAHIFQSRGSVRHPLPVPEVGLGPARQANGPADVPDRPRRPRATPADTHLRLLEEFAPPSVLINHEHNMVHLSPRAGRYLTFAGGEPSESLLRAVRPELRIDLHSALYQAAQTGRPVDARGLRMCLDDGPVTVNLSVRPISGGDEPARGYFLVLFEETTDGADEPARPVPLPDADAAHQLEAEVRLLKDKLRGAVERHGTQAEELRASNEELQAMNEELRSSAEELETSKEELQSLNEELRTVNQELKIKVDEQAQVADDIQNLVNSTDIGTIFLDRLSRVKRFTPRARDIFQLIPSDLGRPLSDVTHALRGADLDADIERVLDRLERVDREVETRAGRWYLMRIVPYRTSDDRIDGVVLTFVDITEQKYAESVLRVSEEALRTAHGGLEKQVTQRTSELASAISRLDVEVRGRQDGEQRVRGLLGQLITAQEVERQRIARDLHDHLGQQIAGLRLRLESLRTTHEQQKPLQDELSLVEGLIDRLDRDLDFFTWELRPPTLDDLGIVVALENFVREWSRNFSIPARFRGGLEEGRLAPAIETTLYRIAQEALNNVYKHADASQVGVQLEQRDDDVVLIIEDDGRGFDRTRERTGDRALGIIGMIERAMLVGGSLDIETAPGKGTTIFVRVPARFA